MEQCLWNPSNPTKDLVSYDNFHFCVMLLWKLSCYIQESQRWIEIENYPAVKMTEVSKWRIIEAATLCQSFLFTRVMLPAEVILLNYSWVVKLGKREDKSIFSF